MVIGSVGFEAFVTERYMVASMNLCEGQMSYTQVEDSDCRKIRGILPESMGSYRNPIGLCRIPIVDLEFGKLWE